MICRTHCGEHPTRALHTLHGVRPRRLGLTGIPSGMERCALCHKIWKLCKSHIIPEFTYKPIYDDNHRFVTFEPLTPEQTRTRKKGVWWPLLCGECEQFLNNRFEQPFQRYWMAGNALAALETKRSTRLIGIDYGPFKLFHLSVLFRASVCDRPEFAEVDLGTEAAEEIRQMILKEDPGPAWKYSIVCSAIEGESGKVWDDLVASPFRVRVRGRLAYLFTFCGCQWFYVVSPISDPEIEKIALTDGGELPVVKREWEVLRHARQELHHNKGS